MPAPETPEITRPWWRFSLSMTRYASSPSAYRWGGTPPVSSRPTYCAITSADSSLGSRWHGLMDVRMVPVKVKGSCAS